jgi:hypothetical protein
LQYDNDGLWYRGDAARHALNGFFWSDYLRDFTWDAKGYALSYYARYPAIDPASRPPLFYLLEGAAFKLFGPSPFVAKGLVLCFALLAAIYLWAWLRRWVAEDAAWAAPLLLLLPGVTRWSHAIMLHVPAMALSMGALYHARCWLETPSTSTRDFWLAVVLSLLAILTYYPAGIVVFIIAGWAALLRRWDYLVNREKIVPAVLAVLASIPFAWLSMHWAPTHLGWVLPPVEHLGTVSTWTYYFEQLKYICNPYFLGLAMVGVLVGLWSGRWRRETMMFTAWLVVTYVVLSFLFAKDVRYALPMSLPLVGLAAIAILVFCKWLGTRLRLKLTTHSVSVAVFLSLLVLEVYLASNYRVISVTGYRELTSFLARVAPEEPVFYDGFYDGIFIFYVRADDPQFRRRVVLGHKLLYTYAMFPGWLQQNFTNSPEEMIEVLRRRGGARWLAIEMGKETESLVPMRHLRQAVKTSAFELVQSFPIQAYQTDRVDVYRLKLPVAEVDEVELPFPVLGEGVKFRVRPIPSRHGRSSIVDSAVAEAFAEPVVGRRDSQ